MISNIYPVADIGPALSTFALVATSLATAAGAVVAWRRARERRRLAAEAAALLDPERQPRAGTLHEGATVLTGVVAHADDHDVAVRIDVRQQGDESESSGSWSYSWTEIDRKIVVKPFYLELTDGTRVRVLAPPTVEVADALDQKVLISRNQRVLSAELIPGETLHAQGWLERGSQQLRPGGEAGYRDAEYEWQLVPERGRMLLSSEPLGKGFEDRARFHGRYARRFVFVLVLIQLLFVQFYSRAFATDAVGTVARRVYSESTDSDGDTTHYYALVLQLPDAVEELQVDSDDWRRVHEGSQVVARRGILGYDLGGAPTVFFLTAILAVVFTLGLWSLYRARRTATRPWFKRRLKHSGSGMLPGEFPTE